MQNFHDLYLTLPTDEYHKQEYLRGSKELRQAQNKTYALSKKKESMEEVLSEGDAMLMHSKWGSIPIAKIEAYIFHRKCWDLADIAKNATQVKLENKPPAVGLKKRRVVVKHEIKDAVVLDKKRRNEAMDVDENIGAVFQVERVCTYCCTTKTLSVAPPCCGAPLICEDCEINFFAQKRTQVRCMNCFTMVPLARSSWKSVSTV
jgi:hypothetical protein